MYSRTVVIKVLTEVTPPEMLTVKKPHASEIPSLTFCLT